MLNIKSILDAVQYAKLHPQETILTNTTMDKFVGGLVKNQLNLICGGTGTGKSLVAINIANELSKNYKVLYISAENTVSIDVGRLKTYGNFDYINIFNGADYGDKFELLATLKELNTTDYGYDIVFIDGLETEVDMAENLYREGNKFSKSLVDLAKKYTVVVNWQLGRGNINKKIDELSTDDIASSMGLARYSAVVYIVKKNKEKNGIEIKCAKTRVESKSNYDTTKIYDFNYGLEMVNPIPGMLD